MIIDLAADDLNKLFNRMWSEILVEVKMRKGLRWPTDQEMNIKLIIHL